MRKSYADYGLAPSRARELLKECRAGKHSGQLREAAYATDPCIAGYMLLAIEKGLSYDRLQILWELREIERIPCGKTNFYECRRHTLAILNNMLMGKGRA